MPLRTDDEDDILAAADDWQDMMVDIILDSGACRHVMAGESAPGYPVRESPGSRRGQNFIVGNGERVPNEGQMILNLETDDGAAATATFQVADLTRPLMSVSQICEQGYRCIFEDSCARVVNKDDQTICKFEKEGQLYVAKMKLKAPDRFPRPS